MVFNQAPMIGFGPNCSFTGARGVNFLEKFSFKLNLKKKKMKVMKYEKTK